jgi:hypothetical protein
MNGKKLVLAMLGALLVVTMGWAQDSINVSTLGQYEYWSSASDVVTSGSYAYVAETYAMHILNVSNPTAPVEVGHCQLPNSGRTVAVNGAYAYVGTYNALCVIDVSNPAQPRIVGQCPIPQSSLTNAISEYPYVYATTYTSLYIIDVSNPTNPIIAGSLNTSSGYTYSLAKLGSLVYLTDGPAGVRIVDVSNPATPTIVGGFHTPNYARLITIQDSLAYVLDGNDEWTPAAGLMIYNLADPIHPALLSTYGAYVRCYDIKVNGNYAYLASYYLLWIIDVSNPLAPQEVGMVGHIGNVGRMYIEGTHLYAAGEGLTILDITDPPTPVWISHYYVGYGAREIAVHGSYAYAVNYYQKGLDVLDVSDPTDPQWLSFCPSPEAPRNVALDWPYAYLADMDGGLRIINVSNPQEPFEAAFFDPGPYILAVSDVALDSTLAYLAGGSAGLAVVDVSNPLRPRRVGGVYGVQPYLIKVIGSYAYTAEASASPFDGMRIFSLADPLHPVQIGSVAFTGTVQDMDVEGDHAFVTTSTTLYIFNVSNPIAPFLISSSTTWEGYSLDAVGSLLYVVKADLFVLHITAQGNPTQVGFYNIPQTGRGVTVVDSVAYVGRDYYFTIFDCSDCNSAAISDQLATPAEKADSPSAFPAGTHSSNLQPCHPNPFNPTTAISYKLQAPSWVSLKVYDISGRLVATLVDGWREAGTHQVTFDGSNLAAGIYLLKMQAGDYSVVQKLVLVK